MTFCVNGLLYFKGMRFEVESETVDNYSSADLPSVITEIKNNPGEEIGDKLSYWISQLYYFKKNFTVSMRYYSIVNYSLHRNYPDFHMSTLFSFS